MKMKELLRFIPFFAEFYCLFFLGGHIGEADRYFVRKRLENYRNKKSVQKTENIRRKQEKENER